MALLDILSGVPRFILLAIAIVVLFIILWKAWLKDFMDKPLGKSSKSSKKDVDNSFSGSKKKLEDIGSEGNIEGLINAIEGDKSKLLDTIEEKINEAEANSNFGPEKVKEVKALISAFEAKLSEEAKVFDSEFKKFKLDKKFTGKEISNMIALINEQDNITKKISQFQAKGETQFAPQVLALIAQIKAGSTDIANYESKDAQFISQLKSLAEARVGLLKDITSLINKINKSLKGEHTLNKIPEIKERLSTLRQKEVSLNEYSPQINQILIQRKGFESSIEPKLLQLREYIDQQEKLISASEQALKARGA
ncbi:MAG: hypothetical protein Q8Q35_01730 [Nanoarchaeota archaeon]|nr:hypothetical protein [Nanoarchaeota archaeon]